MRSLCFILLILGFYLNIAEAVCFFTNGYRVHITNEIISGSVTVHCQSKDTDLGTRVLKYKDDIGWKFCVNFLRGNTLYFCHFWRNPFDRVFDVFNKTMYKACSDHEYDGNKCIWSIKVDGFYFFDHQKKMWVKQYAWRKTTYSVQELAGKLKKDQAR